MTWLMPSTSMPRAAMSVATSVRDAAVAEVLQHALALVLRLVAVDRLGGDAVLVEAADHLVGAVLGAGEDQHAVDLLLLRRRSDSIFGLLPRSTWTIRCAMRSTVVACGVTDTLAGSFSMWRASSAMSSGMVAENSSVCRSLGQLGDDLPDVADEAHVEHAVGFVEHEHLDAVETQRVALHQVEQAARRRHQHVDAVRQRAHLRRPC